jgi:hypothetical protein
MRRLTYWPASSRFFLVKFVDDAFLSQAFLDTGRGWPRIREFKLALAYLAKLIHHSGSGMVSSGINSSFTASVVFPDFRYQVVEVLFLSESLISR